jgi:putative nucleotidyltransferase with HDIG domain
MLSSAQKRKIEAFAKKCAKSNDEFHGFSHFINVAQNAIMLAKEEGADGEVCWASAMLHDICKCKSGNHGTEGAKKARKFLESLKLEESFIKRVYDAIYFHNKGFRKGPIERQVLWDADKLQIIGPYWFFMRHLRYTLMMEGEEKGVPHSISEYKFFEARFHTKSARKTVKEKAKLMRPIFSALIREHKKVHPHA